MKILRTTMPNGSQWDIPVNIIAENRANYYMSNEPGSDYDEEYEECMNDHGEIQDWAENNMNWDDVKEHAFLHSGADVVDYQDGWVNGEKSVMSSANA